MQETQGFIDQRGQGHREKGERGPGLVKEDQVQKVGSDISRGQGSQILERYWGQFEELHVKGR